MIILIAAIGKNKALGKDNKLLWHLPDDFKHFKNLTTAHHIIMGRKTFESFKGLLPKRTHVIITRQKDYKAPEGCIVVHSLEQALEVCKMQEKVFVIGGGEIYTLALEHADVLKLTQVDNDFDADAFFPEFSLEEWELTKEEFHPKDDKHLYDFTFLTYQKK